ncbi:multidrug resistance protein [Agrobacterium vitis]|uniref:HlyD family secretion protein n=1 Tax=Agrobacterium vitis TaxID=373 RepID=UPI0015DCBF8E|nr:HlyD family secretion protein [Agrobacterium vitis]BCH63903.1 multidrug resistance protein [Agrobacterium vitis]
MSVSPRKGAIRAVDAQDQSVDQERSALDEGVTGEAGSDPVTGDATARDAKARAETASPAAKVAPAAGQAPPKKRRSFALPVIALAVLAGAGYYGYNYWTEGRFMISTDDAYIGGDIAVITPKVTGYVKSVSVTDNDHVKKGDVIATLDDGDYRIALDQAKSQLATQKLTVDRIEAQVQGGEAALQQSKAQQASAEATLRTAQLSFKRVTDLRAQSVMSQSELDTATSTLAVAQANVDAAVAAVASSVSSIAVLKAQKAEAQAGVLTEETVVAKAQRDLDFTVLRAPYDGVIGNLAVQVGDLVSSSKRLASLVPIGRLYIDANFKETQLSGIVPGSKVRVHVDAYDEHAVDGTVVSIAAGSGSIFSMLPAENATGNFTKVIQRVPVRISIPQDVLDKGYLRAGLSVVVDVDTRTAPKAPDAK